MAFNFASYDFSAVRSSHQLSRDFQAVRSEMMVKEALYASARRDLEASVSQAPAVLDNESYLRKLQSEVRKLRELYEAIKAMHFYTYSAVPYNKEAEQQKVRVAVQGYRQITDDLSSPGDFGVTPPDDNGVPRKLDAEWCLNEHLNGYNLAPRRYVPL